MIRGKTIQACESIATEILHFFHHVLTPQAQGQTLI
jgi:hypothetical protein